MQYFYRIILLYLLTISAAHAMHILGGQVDPPLCDTLGKAYGCLAVNFQRVIKPGDAEKLREKLADINKISPHDFRVGMIYLNSPGGDVMEAMKIGHLIRDEQMSTFVPHDFTCASACALLLAAGVTRGAAGPLIIHSFYSPEFLGSGDFADANRQFDKISQAIRDYLKQMRVPATLLDEMLKIPFYKQKQLTIDEQAKYGLLGIDPVYAIVRKSK
ncbi:MAG: hypothetical protein EPN34_01030 [Burkholderiaceae bacterium]|nr:MAG: hypothetical protein EPN34_01030 [Burkholderiaceae bacterium]